MEEPFLELPASVLGARIAELRRVDGVSQRELAELLDVHQSTLSRIEAGERPPSLAEILALAQVFGVATDELLRGEARPFARVVAEDEDTRRAVERMRDVIEDYHAYAELGGP